MSDKKVAKKVNLVKIVEPKFLTMTKLPANQVAFRIVREDKETLTMTTETQTAGKRRVRALRADSPLLALAFADGTTQEEATEIMAEYGLVDFSITELDGKVVALRSDAKSLPEGAITVTLQEGTRAYILKRDDASPSELPNIAITALRFSHEAFPDEMDVTAWLNKHDVDFLENGTQNLGTETVVARSELQEGSDTRTLELETGVIAVVARAEALDVPESMVAVVSEAAYGNWGWGQLDFLAALADVQFSEASREALYKLDDVLRNIMFYSPLPVSVKKDLVNRAAGQFAGYIGALMDALPAQVVIATRSAIQPKEKDMAKEDAAPTTNTEEAARSDANAVAEASATDAQGTPAKKTTAGEAVTRSEVATMIEAAVTAAITAVRAETSAAATPAVAESAIALEAVAVRSDAGSGDIMEFMRSSFEKLGESVKDMAGRLEKVESTTVVRSDNGDGKQSTAKDPFKGVFGGAAK